MNESIIHVVSKKAAEGGRIYSQSSYRKACIYYASIYQLPFCLFCLLTKRKAKKVVFHEQYSLISLIISFLINLVLVRKHTLVYDMHDLVEIRNYPKLRTKFLSIIFVVLEFLVLTVFRISVITVSESLSKAIKQRYRVTSYVVYNIPPKLAHKDSRERKNYFDSSALVYFGIIEPIRLDISTLEDVVSKGYRVDVYGYFSKNCEKHYKNDLEALITSSGGNFKGEYRPDNINFLENYAGVLMIYKTNSKNVKGCLPNKLFQSMRFKKQCVVSRDMLDAWELFSDCGSVVDKVDDLTGPDEVDWNFVNKKIADIEISSKKNFLEALGVD